MPKSCKKFLYFTFIYTLFLVSIQCTSQTKKTDSLRVILYSTTDINIKKQTLFQLLDNNKSYGIDSFIQYVSLAKDIFSSAGTEEEKCTILRKQIYIYTEVNKLDSAQLLYNQTLNTYSNNPKLKESLLRIRHTYNRFLINQGKYKEAVDSLLEILKSGETINSKTIQSLCTNSIGLCYMNMGQDAEAIKWFNKIIQNSSKESQALGMQYLYNNSASCLNNINQFDSAMLYVDTAIALAKKNEDVLTLANGLNIKADIYLNLKKYDKAEKLLQEAIEYRKLSNNPDYLASDMAQFAIFYAKTEKFDKGIPLAKEAIKIFRENNLGNKVMFGYEALKENYFRKKDYKEYANTLNEMLALKDSLYKANSAEEMAGLQTKYDVQKKEALIAKQKLALLQSNVLIFGGSILFLLIGLVSFFAFRRYKLKQKIAMEKALEEEKIQHTKQVKEAEEKERKRIAAELHDNMGVQANAILHNTTLLTADKNETEKVIENLQDTAKEMLGNLRETVWALKSTTVTTIDIWLRIINFIKQMQRHYDTVKFEIEGTPPENKTISSVKALHIIMIVKESVNNSVKHSSASTIKVIGSNEYGKWKIVVTDNGKGFNVREKSSGFDSNGLSNIKERAETANFSVQIDSQIGYGTTTTLTTELQEITHK